MYARNRINKQPVIGTLEKLEGRADIVPDSFNRRPNGEVGFQHGDHTEVFWNAQRTETKEGRTVFLDEAGKAVTAEEIELVEDPSQLTPGDTTLTDVIALYELMDERTGARRGPYTELNDAELKRGEHEVVRYATYCITSDTGTMEAGRPEPDPREAG